MSDHDLRTAPAACNALTALHHGLPARWYHDPAHHEIELTRLWRGSWLYLCHGSALADPLSYVTDRIGDQPVAVVRQPDGGLSGFLNTCRHRGSILLTAPSGRLGSKAIVCPYHQWAFACDTGRLVRTTSFAEPAGFDRTDFPLFPISVHVWHGCVFINLDPAAAWDAGTVFQRNPPVLNGFPLADLVVGHTWTKTIACNWKTFWENFSECLHCPNVHPELSDLVPLYGRRLISPDDVPDHADHAGSTDPRHTGGLRAGAETWSMDGSAQGRAISGRASDGRTPGQAYGNTWPSMFLAGYADHARIVRMRPLGPERTELTAEWLFPAETLADPAYDIRNVVDFAMLVMDQDGAACELNQRGLHTAPFQHGVLMPEEWLVKAFHDWVRAGLDPAPSR